MRSPASRFFARVGALAAKETLHIRRDPRTLYIAFGMPVVMLLLFGYGVSFDIERIPLAVVDHDGTAASRDLLQAFDRSGDFSVAARVTSAEDAGGLMRRGTALATLVVPRGLEKDLARGRNGPVQLLVDGADGVVANQVLAKSDAIARAHGMALARRAGITASPPLAVKVWSRFNPSGKSAFFLVPGLTGFLMAIAAVLLTALAIAGEWERGSMEQLFASPVGRLEIILGKLLPYLVIGELQMLTVLAVGTWVFGVPIVGSFTLLMFVGTLFLLGMLGQGLFISVVAKNQMVATQAGALSSLLPSMLLSGFVFPIENMPLVLQWLSRVVPARYLVRALRGILLKGTGWNEHWPDALALAIFAAVVLAVATARFRRRVA